MVWFKKEKINKFTSGLSLIVIVKKALVEVVSQRLSIAENHLVLVTV